MCWLILQRGVGALGKCRDPPASSSLPQQEPEWWLGEPSGTSGSQQWLGFYGMLCAMAQHRWAQGLVECNAGCTHWAAAQDMPALGSSRICKLVVLQNWTPWSFEVPSGSEHSVELLGTAVMLSDTSLLKTLLSNQCQSFELGGGLAGRREGEKHCNPKPRQAAKVQGEYFKIQGEKDIAVLYYMTNKANSIKHPQYIYKLNFEFYKLD